MTTLVRQMIADSNKRTIHQLLALAKLLEKMPSTTFEDDEGNPLSEWNIQVDKLMQEIISAFGRRDGFSVLVKKMLDLEHQVPNIERFLKERGGTETPTPSNETVWMRLFYYAENQERQHAAVIRAVEETASARVQVVEGLQKETNEALEEAKADISMLHGRIAQLERQLANTTGGVAIINIPDE